jgi:hypothetical protein
MSRQIYGTWTLIVTTSPRLERYLHAKVICDNCVRVLIPSYDAFLGVPVCIVQYTVFIGSLSKSIHKSLQYSICTYVTP